MALNLEPGAKPIIFTRAPDKDLQKRSFLAQFAGEYEVMGLTLTVTLKGDTALAATIPGQPAYELEPYQGMEFRVKGHTEVSVTFTSDEAGQVIEAKLQQPQGTVSARKKM